MSGHQWNIGDADAAEAIRQAEQAQREAEKAQKQAETKP